MATDLRLNNSSLYSDGVVVEINGDTPELYRDEVEWRGNIDDQNYTVRIGDTALSIAYAKYRDNFEDPERYYWLIMDANKEIENALDLSEFVGKDIIVPNIFFYNTIR